MSSPWDKDSPKTWFAIVMGTAIQHTFHVEPTITQLSNLVRHSPNRKVMVETWEGGHTDDYFIYREAY